MKIGTRVYVSFLSGSKIAGEVGTIVGVSTRDGYKVRTDFGVVGYVKAHHATEIFEDAPVENEVPVVKVGGPVTNAQKAAYFNSLMDMDVAHMYLTPILPPAIKPVEKDPTDLLCSAVRFRRLDGSTVCGWVSDQWIEDGVELLNVVHDGDYSVVPFSFILNVFAK